MNTKKLSLFLIILMAVGLVGLTATATVSEPTVGLDTAATDTAAQYSISFDINSSLAIGSGQLIITFPSATAVPTSFSDGDITVEGSNVLSGDVSVSSNVVTITLAQALSAGTTVDVVFTSAAGVKNPTDPGYYQLDAETNKETSAKSSEYYAIQDAPTISSISPKVGTQGSTDVSVTIDGTNLLEVSDVDFGSGITVKSFTNKSQSGTSGTTSMTATIDIASDATVGLRSVTVTTAVDSATYTDAFDVQAPPSPNLNTVVGTTYQGANDTVKLTFSSPVEPVDGTWSANEFAAVTNGSTAISLSNANFTSPSGLADTLTITLSESDGEYLVNGTGNLVVTPASDAIEDAAEQTVPNTAVTGDVDGDTTGPDVALSYSPTPPVNDADTLTITAEFSEKVQDTPEIDIDNSVLSSAQAMSMGADRTVWTYDLNVPDSDVDAATVTIVANDLAGNANNAATNNTFEIDNTAPDLPSGNITGTTIAGGGDTIALTFDEDVEAADGTWSKNEFASVKSPTGEALTLTNAEFSYSPNTLTITLNEATDGAYLVNGNDVAVTPATDAIVDKAGNSLGDSEVTSNSTVDGETTNYNVSAVKGDADVNEVTVTFDEAVVPSDGTWSANEFSTFNNPSGIAVNIDHADFSTNSDPGPAPIATEVTVALNESVDGSTLKAGSGNLSVTVTDVVDLAGNSASSDNATGDVITGENPVKLYDDSDPMEFVDSYESIDAAIGDASTGYTVKVGAGYNSSVETTTTVDESSVLIKVDEEVEIAAAEGASPVIDADGADRALMIPDGVGVVAIEGLTFKGAASRTVTFGSGNDVLFKGNRVEANGAFGLWLGSNSSSIFDIIDNELVDVSSDPVNASSGIRVGNGTEDNGYSVDGLSIESNEIENFQQGVLLGAGAGANGTTGATIKGNLFNNSGLAGVQMKAGKNGKNSKNHSIIENTFKNTKGLYTDGSEFGAAVLIIVNEGTLDGININRNTFDGTNNAALKFLEDTSGTVNEVDATANYWGAASGPSGDVEDAGSAPIEIADGEGETIVKSVSSPSTYPVKFVKWLNAPYPDGRLVGTISGQSMDFEPEWNLMSVDFEPADPSPAAVFNAGSNDLLGQVFRWFPADDEYGTASALEDVDGTKAYWVYAGNSGLTSEGLGDGTAVKSAVTLELTNAGWHMISAPFAASMGQVEVTYDETDYTMNEATSGADAIVDSVIWDYAEAGSDSATDAGYVSLDSTGAALSASEGYWLKTFKDDVTLTIPFKPGTTPGSSSVSAMNQAAALSASQLSADVEKPPAPPVAPQAAEGLKATAVSTADGVTFEVAGAEVDSMKVQVFNTEGVEVFADSASANSLTWDASVANGVYLYGVSAEVNGQVKPLGIQKLLILE